MSSATFPQETERPSSVLPEYDDASERLARNAVEALRAHPRFRNRTASIRVDCHHERLIVTGRMPSFYLKQLLQEALRHVDGVGEIDNRVDVESLSRDHEAPSSPSRRRVKHFADPPALMNWSSGVS